MKSLFVSCLLFLCLGSVFPMAYFILPPTLAPLYLFVVFLGFVSEITLRIGEMFYIIRGNFKKALQSFVIVLSLFIGVFLTSHLITNFDRAVSSFSSALMILISLLVFFFVITKDKYYRVSIKSHWSINTLLWRLCAFFFLVWLMFYCPWSYSIENNVWLTVHSWICDWCYLLLSMVVFIGGFELSTSLVALLCMIINTE